MPYTLGERLRYAFDNTMSKGAPALIAWLGLVSAVLIVAGALGVYAFGLLPDKDLPHLLWMSMMRALDAGTVGGDEGSWAYLLTMFAVTLGGVFILSTLIGVLTTGINARLEALRKGRSRVIERHHTVILGWSEHVFTIVAELAVANENQRRPCIVILADKDKVEMEDELRDKVGDTKNTRVVCRTGSPTELGDLEIASIHASRSIIVLAPDAADPDPETVKVILAVTNNPNRRREPYHLVAEIHDPRNVEVAKMVGKDEVELVLVSDLVARIVAQTCLQSGLSVVYQELLDFGGDEMYMFEHPSLVGKTYGETLTIFEDSAVIGLHPKDAVPLINPPMDTALRAGDRLVVIAEDDDAMKLSGKTDFGIDAGAIAAATAAPALSPRRVLILGWNWRATTIVNQLDAYVAPGSQALIVADHDAGAEALAKHCGGLQNLTVSFQAGDVTERRTLDALRVPEFHHVILLSYSDRYEPHEADAKTLFTLLHLRDIADRTGKTFSIVSEMLDVRNRRLAEVTRADDFIVSDRLVSLLLTQISENKALNAVFTDMFDPEGSEIYLKPAERYVRPGAPVNFYTVIEAARRLNETAIGYRLAAHAGDAAKDYGVKTNPVKAEEVVFSPGDKIIVAADS